MRGAGSGGVGTGDSAQTLEGAGVRVLALGTGTGDVYDTKPTNRTYVGAADASRYGAGKLRESIRKEGKSCLIRPANARISTGGACEQRGSVYKCDGHLPPMAN